MGIMMTLITFDLVHQMLPVLDRLINVKEKNNFGFQHSIGVYFVPFIDIKTYAKNQSDQIMFSDLSTISKF